MIDWVLLDHKDHETEIATIRDVAFFPKVGMLIEGTGAPAHNKRYVIASVLQMRVVPRAGGHAAPCVFVGVIEEKWR